jgi:hypothetical protein
MREIRTAALGLAAAFLVAPLARAAPRVTGQLARAHR